jgi:hypothetical protein
MSFLSFGCRLGIALYGSHDLCVDRVELYQCSVGCLRDRGGMAYPFWSIYTMVLGEFEAERISCS